MLVVGKGCRRQGRKKKDETMWGNTRKGGGMSYFEGGGGGSSVRGMEVRAASRITKVELLLKGGGGDSFQKKEKGKIRGIHLSEGEKRMLSAVKR